MEKTKSNLALVGLILIVVVAGFALYSAVVRQRTKEGQAPAEVVELPRTEQERREAEKSKIAVNQKGIFG